MLTGSKLFDRHFYLESNPDIRSSLLSPVRHYLLYGGFEGRKPSAFFDSALYLQSNPDVASQGMNPLVHYLKHGKKEQRSGGVAAEPKPLPVEVTETAAHRLLQKSKQLLSRFSDHPEVNLVRDCPYFNAGYYLRVNTDVRACGMDPAVHYCDFGWKEGRNPGPLFDTAYYLETYDDVRVNGLNPLVHFLKFGEKERRLPRPFEYDESSCMAEADISDTDFVENIQEPGKIAVVCHLFHLDLADEFITCFRRIPFVFDLYITASAADLPFLEDIINKELPAVPKHFMAVGNTGRDVAPFLTILAGQLMRYDLVCKVHSKKSSHDKNLNDWRGYMLDHLLGSRMIVQRIICAFKDDQRLGLIWPLPHPYLKHLGIDKGWGPAVSREANRHAAMRYFAEIDPPAPEEEFGFPAGNMYWFRPEALKYLAEKDFKPEDFSAEEGQIDGTMAHAMERLTGRIAEKAGFSTATVFFSRAIIHADSDNKINFPEGTKKILFIAHDLFRAGAEILLLHILNWLNQHTAFKLYVLAIKKGNDGGKLLPDYRRVATIILLDELLALHPEPAAFRLIREQTGEVDLVYGNTILAAGIYPMTEGFRVPVITHIHELEASIQKYTTPEIRRKMKQATTVYIACSEPVKQNLISHHGIVADQIKMVEAFIRPGPHPLPGKEIQRKKMGMPSGKVIIWGCGTIYWRKGTDLFIKTAGILKNMGFDNFLFCWIGANHWNNDATEWGTWEKQEAIIKELSPDNLVKLLGEKERPKDYFKAGDIYFLPSREDPYPLVCLEAAECELPIVCFADAGGMPAFVGNDAGEVVPYLDTIKAAEAIGRLISDPETRYQKGKNARNKLLRQHTDDIAVPKILQICRDTMQTPPVVSVIVPVYNHAPFLLERLDSILNQRFRDVEVIILDDASIDESAEIASDYLFHPAVRLIRNKKNSGSPFRQWQEGIKEATGQLIWIAEGDDSADPDFLGTLIPAFNDTNTVMAYCGSHCTDEDGVISRQHYLRSGHYEGLGHPRERWLSDYMADGTEEIIHALAIRNTIPNVSAVLFRRCVFDQVDFTATDHFRTAGDWLIYLSILKQGKLTYFHQHLNYHRIRSASVVGSHKTEAVRTLPDYFGVHRYIVENFEIPVPVRELMISSVTSDLRKLWPDLSDEEFLKLYDPVLIRNR